MEWKFTWNWIIFARVQRSFQDVVKVCYELLAGWWENLWVKNTTGKIWQFFRGQHFPHFLRILWFQSSPSAGRRAKWRPTTIRRPWKLIQHFLMGKIWIFFSSCCDVNRITSEFWGKRTRKLQVCQNHHVASWKLQKLPSSTINNNVMIY